MSEPSTIHVPELPKSPARFVISGVCDKIPDLRKYVAGLDCDPDLRKYIDSELDEITTNAAEIHLHNVDGATGGMNLHLTITPVHLGAPVS